MKKEKKHRVWLTARLRNYFLAGLLITAPLGLTVYIAWNVATFVDAQVFGLLPDRYNPSTYLPFSVPGIGLLLVVAALIVIGALTAGIVGRLFQQLVTNILNRLPVIRSVYGGIRQVFETVFAKQATAFRQTVLVEYPRKGSWTLGFLTGMPGRNILEKLGEETVCVFVPTAPNPTSGFLIFVQPFELIALDMKVEEGIKWVISGGLAQESQTSRSVRKIEK